MANDLIHKDHNNNTSKKISYRKTKFSKVINLNASREIKINA